MSRVRQEYKIMGCNPYNPYNLLILKLIIILNCTSINISDKTISRSKFFTYYLLYRKILLLSSSLHLKISYFLKLFILIIIFFILFITYYI